MFCDFSLKNVFTGAVSGAMLFVWCGAPMAQVVDANAAAFAAQVQASMLALEDGDRDAPRPDAVVVGAAKDAQHGGLLDA